MKYEAKTLTLKDGRVAVIRAAQMDDAAEMIRFLTDVSGETDFLLATPEEWQGMTVEAEQAFLSSTLASENELMLTAWVDGTLAGVANISFFQRKKLRHRASVAISSRRAYWGLGLGKALLGALVDTAKARPEVRQVELEFIEGNTRARALYERLGFRVVGVRPDAYARMDGTLRNEYMMMLKIREE